MIKQSKLAKDSRIVSHQQVYLMSEELKMSSRQVCSFFLNENLLLQLKIIWAFKGLQFSVGILKTETFEMHYQ